MSLVAGILQEIFACEGVVFGGFVRDHLVPYLDNNLHFRTIPLFEKEITDIDVWIQGELPSKLVKSLKEKGFQVEDNFLSSRHTNDSEKWQSEPYKYRGVYDISFGGKTVKIDIITSEHFPVNDSVCNCLSYDGEEIKANPLYDWEFKTILKNPDVHKVIELINKKIFLYSHVWSRENPDWMSPKARLEYFESKGWHNISDEVIDFTEDGTD